jgi:RNA polymerase sigma-70 factor (ECF subfamily)
LDARLHGRLGVSDVLQEAYLEAAQHLGEYLREPKMPFYLWLRGIANNKVCELHRHHFGVQKRDVSKDVSLVHGAQTTTIALATLLAGREERPSQVAMRAELRVQLQQALEQLDPLDCEVLSLRHFEQLSNNETAEMLGIEPSAASKRYVRALRRLKDVLTGTGKMLSAEGQEP